jgi:hypothetical protein
LRAARAAIALACVMAAIALAPLPARASEVGCNGEAALCARPLGEVAFATTHNSMASTANGFVPPNQRRSMRAQLEHGIRAFQIDAFFGTPRGGRVSTDLSGPLGDAAELPTAVLRGAQRIHQSLGAPPPGTPHDVYLCHVFCELGAVKMLDEMRVVRAFLDAHPREVLVMVIEDYVPPAAIREVLRDAGLESELLAAEPAQPAEPTQPAEPAEPAKPLPTLGEMIDAGTRLEVSLENGDDPPTLPNAFTGLVQETPFTFRRPRDLERPSSCATNRGTDDAPVFQFNHWVTPAEPVTARRVNTSILRERLVECTARRERGPTLVAVDFAEQGDVLGVVERLNR